MLEKAFRINKPNDYNEMLKLSRIFLATITPKNTVHLVFFQIPPSAYCGLLFDCLGIFLSPDD